MNVRLLNVTNGQKYFDDIIKINNCDFAFDKTTGKVMNCNCTICQKCLFSSLSRPKEVKSCSEAKMRWLIKEV